MAEILVKAISATHSDPIKDQRGCYKRGMPVVIMPDGHQWGNEERLPKFVIIKIPDISKTRLEKYLFPQLSGEIIIRRRLWQIRVEDLPVLAKNKLASNGELTIKATDIYNGSFDYTWTKIKEYFRNLETGLDETQDP